MVPSTTPLYNRKTLTTCWMNVFSYFLRAEMGQSLLYIGSSHRMQVQHVNMADALVSQVVMLESLSGLACVSRGNTNNKNM